jgi:hypothetical protein
MLSGTFTRAMRMIAVWLRVQDPALVRIVDNQRVQDTSRQAMASSNSGGKIPRLPAQEAALGLITPLGKTEKPRVLGMTTDHTSMMNTALRNRVGSKSTLNPMFRLSKDSRSAMSPSSAAMMTNEKIKEATLEGTNNPNKEKRTTMISMEIHEHKILVAMEASMGKVLDDSEQSEDSEELGAYSGVWVEVRRC